MSNDIYMRLIKEIQEAYGEIDRYTRCFKVTTGIRCPRGCGICCENETIEATALECLPLAAALYDLSMAETVYDRIEEWTGAGNNRCVIYDPGAGNGGSLPDWHCTMYRFRPLLCRLFGYAVRRSKRGDLEFRPCKMNKEKFVTQPAMPVSADCKAPVYQDCFMRIAGLDPGLGMKRYPINIAIQKAIAQLYWSRPAKKSYRKAS